MMSSMYSGISGLNACTQRMAVIGDNIANVNTTAYKSSELSFENLINQSVGGFTGQEIGSGVLTGALRYDWNQGTIQKTSSPYDIAIAGNGYFKVMDGLNATASKSYYTRDGQFSFTRNPYDQTDTNYYLMTDSGMFVQGANGPITYPPETYDSITVDDSGIYYGVDSTGAKTPLDQIQIYDVQDPSVMAKTSKNLYMKTTDETDLIKSGNPGTNGLGAVETSSLEMSNVDIAKEFVNMITAQRAFSANSKVITTSDEILQELVNIKR